MNLSDVIDLDAEVEKEYQKKKEALAIVRAMFEGRDIPATPKSETGVSANKNGAIVDIRGSDSEGNSDDTPNSKVAEVRWLIRQFAYKSFNTEDLFRLSQKLNRPIQVDRPFLSNILWRMLDGRAPTLPGLVKTQKGVGKIGAKYHYTPPSV